MNKYLQIKKAHQEELNNFPMVFAFSQKQFKEGMEKLGLTPDDTDKVCGIGGGGIIRKTDRNSLADMFERHKKEMQNAINSDDQFVFDMFNYELANYEYSYTGDVMDTLRALDLTYEEVEASPRLLTALNAACNAQREEAQYA